MEELTQLLALWKEGAADAPPRIAAQVLPFVRAQARAMLGPALRQKLDSEDLAQDATLDFLQYGPRFVPETVAQLHKLLARIVANTVRDKSQWFAAARRQMGQETRLASSAELPLGSSADPVGIAHDHESALRLRLAMELLDEQDREVLVWHHWERQGFAAIGERLGRSEEGARSLCRRAMVKLVQHMARLRDGGLEAALRAVDAE